MHYRKTEDGHFTYVDEEKRNPFINNAWKVPNQFITGVWEGNPLTLWEDMRKFNEEAIQSCEIGFNFDISPVMTEYFALSDIYSKYKNVLENGLVNPEEGLEAMLAEMYDQRTFRCAGGREKAVCVLESADRSVDCAKCTGNVARSPDGNICMRDCIG